MMSPEEFEKWAKQLNLTDEAKKEIQMIRSSDPSRRVGGGAVNAYGNFPSKKMGLTIQFESHTVELPAIYMMEFDENVLEFYDQPPTLKLAKVGWKTPDFFVIEKDRAYWIEWKTEKDLIKLSQQKNPKFFKDSDKRWHYIPGEEYGKQFNLGFQVGSSEDIDWNLQRNLSYLKDYFRSQEPEDEVNNEIKKEIMNTPGITLKDLINHTGSIFTVDDINTLIALQILYVDLFSSLLAEPDSVKVYLNKEQEKSFLNLRNTAIEKKSAGCSKIIISNGSKIIWGETPWKILNHDNNNVFLLSDTGEHIELKREIFETYISEGYITGSKQEIEPIDDELLKLISSADEVDLKKANEKYEVVTKVLQGEKIGSIGVTDRTISNWVKAFKDAEERNGNGFSGLLPKDKMKGNYNRKISQKAIDLMNEVIEKSYKDIKLKKVKIVYGELENLCEENEVIPPTYQTFCTEINNRSIYDITKSREGRRAAYKYEEFFWRLENTTPKHGDRAFEIAHVDHTELDIELDLGNGKSKRPWCTFLIDAFSRRILAYYLTFEPPSYRSVMQIIRQCVNKYHRLPQTIVVDGGKEFHGVYFESLLAMYNVIKKVRPSAKARFGNVCERLFGVANKLFIHNLIGNTQIMKNVRQVTKSVNPKNHAVWTMGTFTELLEKWIDEVYDLREHPALFISPKEAFTQSIAATGNRPSTYISYNEEFILMTSPAPDKPERKVYPGRGIKFGNFYYWNEKFRDPKIENNKVKIRYDPFNVGVAYAFINKRWEKCLCDYYLILNGKTEKHIKMLSEELRQKRKLADKDGRLTDKMIAKFITEAEEMEEILHQEKHEAKQIETQLKLVNPSNQTEIDIVPKKDEKYFEDDDMDLVFFGEG
jgi:putative transposase